MRAGAGGFGGAVRRIADGVQYLLAGAEAAIEQAAPVQRLDHGGVGGQMIGLAPHRRLPVQPQPGQVFVDARLELGPASRRIDVLYPQHEAPADILRCAPGRQGRKGVPLVQASGRRRGEAGGEHGATRRDQRRWTAPKASACSTAARISASATKSNWAMRFSSTKTCWDRAQCMAWATGPT